MPLLRIRGRGMAVVRAYKSILNIADPIWREYETWACAIKTRIEELKAEQAAIKAKQEAEKAEDEYYIRMENRLLGYGR